MLLCGELSAKVPSLGPLSKKRVLIGWNKSLSVASCLFFGGDRLGRVVTEAPFLSGRASVGL